MAFTDSTPAAANQIGADLTAMTANFTHLKDAFENFVGAWSDSSAAGIFPARVKRPATITATGAMAAGTTFASIDPAAATTYTLLEASACGIGYVLIVRAVDVAYKITIARGGSDTIGGATSFVMFSAGHTVCLVSDGTSAWNIAWEDIPAFTNVVAVDTAEDTNENNLQTITLHGGSLKAGDIVLITARISSSGTNNTRTLNIYFGSTATKSYAKAGAAAWVDFLVWDIVMVEAAAVQAAPLVSLTENTANDVIIKTSGQTANATDEITSHSLNVKLIRA